MLRAVLLALVVVLLSPAAAAGAPANPPSPPEVAEYPEENLPIGVEVVSDGLVDGHWSQTVRLTIKSGGSLSYASLAAFGNLAHTDELFQAAQKLDPSLHSPSAMHTGQEIELTVDPTRSYILQQVANANQQLARTFANGVRETVYRQPTTSVARLVEFPRSPDGGSFVFPNPDGPLTVPSGGRIVEYQYRPGEEFATLIQESLGIATYKAAAEISKQTGWQPTHWPPPTGEAKRVILGPADSYQSGPTDALDVKPPDAAAQAAFDKLAQDRRSVGIYPIRQLPSSTVYRVAVENTSATARDVARLIYGSENDYLDVARQAGFSPPDGNASFNPKLFGTSFDVAVEFMREYFPYFDSHDPQAEAQITRLLNGTVIERFDRIDRGERGVWEITRFPNGYRRIVYSPSGWMTLIGQGLAYVRGLGDLGLDAPAAEARRRYYAGEFLWNWSLNVPREPGDIPDSYELQKIGSSNVLVVVIGPSAPLGPLESLVDQVWNRSPLVKTSGVVVLGVSLVVIVGLLARRRRAWDRE